MAATRGGGVGGAEGAPAVEAWDVGTGETRSPSICASSTLPGTATVQLAVGKWLYNSGTKFILSFLIYFIFSGFFSFWGGSILVRFFTLTAVVLLYRCIFIIGPLTSLVHLRNSFRVGGAVHS